jgi:excisionase family DNA binding protein
MSRPNPAPSRTIRRHELVTVNEAAEYCAVHPKTVRRWIAQGRLTGYSAGPWLIRLDQDELDAMLQSRR